MEIVKEKIDDVTALLKVNVHPEDYREGVNHALREYARKANLPGFRPGKVPLSVIKNMVGKSIVLDELNKTLYDSVNNWIRDNDIEIIGEPLPQPMKDIDLDPDANKAYEFMYEIGLVPEFKVTLQVKDFPEQLTVVVDEAFLDKEVSRMRKRFGKMTNPESSEEGDMLFGFIGETEKGVYAAGKRLKKAYVLNPERGTFSTSLLKKMIGRKEGDVITLKMEDLFSNEGQVRDFWEEHPENGEHFHLSPDQLKAVMEMDFEFEVKKVNRNEEVEINQEFFDKVVGPGKVSSEEEFRKQLKDDYTKHLAGEATKYFHSKVIRSLIEGNDIALSTSFLRKWLKASREKVNDTNVDELLPEYMRDLRWSLIVNGILKENPSYKVTDEDIREKVRGIVATEFGMSDDESADGLIARIMDDKESMSKLSLQILDEKIFAHILSATKPKTKEVSATEFLKLE